MSKQTDLINVTDAITVDSSNNLGIGTSSPDNKLHVYGAATFDGPGLGLVRIKGSGVTKGSLGQANYVISGTSASDFAIASENNFVFGVNNSEAMRIDSAGRVTMPYQPVFDVASNVSNSAGSYVNFTNAYVNQGGYFNLSADRFTAPVSGVYTFTFATIKSSSTGVVMRYQLHKNGVVLHDGRHLRLSEGSNYGDGSCTWTVYLNANDYVQVYVDQGGTHASYNYTWFNGMLVG